MGSFYYGSTPEPITMPDLVLASLQAVTMVKLRRRESFTVSWQHEGHQTGRTTLWLHEAVPLRFVVDDAAKAVVDTTILRHLMEAANSTSGITVDLATHPPISDGAASTTKPPQRQS